MNFEGYDRYIPHASVIGRPAEGSFSGIRLRSDVDERV